MSAKSFTVRGGRNGSQVFVTWTDGVIAGDPPTVDLIQVEAELATLHPYDAHSWSHVNEFGELGVEPLRDPDEAWLLIRSVLDTVTAVEGDAPAAALESPRTKGPWRTATPASQ
jgi:hypothetical protein